MRTCLLVLLSTCFVYAAACSRTVPSDAVDPSAASSSQNSCSAAGSNPCSAAGSNPCAAAGGNPCAETLRTIEPESTHPAPRLVPAAADRFPYAAFDRARACAWSNRDWSEAHGVSNLPVEGTVCRWIEPELIDRITATVSSESGYGNPPMGCYAPHFSVSFFKEDIRIGGFKACLWCSNLEAEPDLHLQLIRPDPEGDGTMDVRTGFSQEGWDALWQICKDIGLGHCPVERRIQDLHTR